MLTGVTFSAGKDLGREKGRGQLLTSLLTLTPAGLPGRTTRPVG